jgi:hypothetical protein
VSDTDHSGLWPKPDTLAAGDEELPVEPYNGMSWDEERTSPSELPIINKRSTSDEDGHLEDDDWHERHPEDP